jgi:hypothetical protein
MNTLVPPVGQAVAVVALVTHRGLRVALEQREKATQAGRVAVIRTTTPSIHLVVVAARAAQVVMAPPVMAVLVAATGRTITPTAPPAARVLERGLAVAVVPAPTTALLLVRVVALAVVPVGKAVQEVAQLPTRAAAAVAVEATAVGQTVMAVMVAAGL